MASKKQTVQLYKSTGFYPILHAQFMCNKKKMPQEFEWF